MIKKNSIRLIFLLSFFFILLFGSMTLATFSQSSNDKHRVSGTLPDIFNSQNKISRLSPDKELKFMNLVLRPRNHENIFAVMTNQQSIDSFSYHQWLTPEQFGENFGRTEEEYSQLINWLQNSGLKIVRTWPNRLQITFEGNVSQIEKVFDLEMNLYSFEGKTEFASDRQPAVPMQFSKEIVGITGLNSLEKFHPLHKILNPEINSLHSFPLARSGGLTPAEFARVYNTNPLLKSNLDGTNVTVAIAARSDFNVSDVELFRSKQGLPSKNPMKVFPFGPQANRGGGEEVEVLLDSEWSGAIAPDANIQVVIGPEITQSVQSIVNDFSSIPIVSISFGSCEDPSIKNDPEFILFNSLYEQAALQGQSVFVSSGDDGVSDCIRINGSTDPAINFLASSPNVIAVGGTTLNFKLDENGNVSGYGEERAWSGSGGGDSIFHNKPLYQQGLIPGNSNRNIPDVALLSGSPGYAITVRGFDTNVGGTSVAAPCWAGLCAILNESKKIKLGNINSELYRLGRFQFYGKGPKVFHDITSGNNTRGSVRGFDAIAGYDRVTGWGSFDADLLVTNFSTAPVTDQISPSIELLSLNGGEEVKFNSTVKINWKSNDNVGLSRHDVFLSLDSGLNYKIPIAIGVSGDAQSIDWKVEELKTNLTAKISVRVTDTSFNTAVAVSSSDFTIKGDDITPKIKIITPNSSKDILKAGSNFNIKWKSSDNIGIASHDIFLSTDGGISFPITIATSLPESSQSFKFLVPTSIEKTKSGRVKIIATDKAGNNGIIVSKKFQIKNKNM